MAKLTRLTAKIFGETADGTLTDPEIGQFGSAKAGTYNGTGDVATIQGLSAWSNGWVDAVTPEQQFPPLPEMTGVHKVLSYQEAYLLQQGVPEWDSATTYYTDGFCSKAGKIYISQSDNNLNNDPASDTVNWQEFVSGGSSRNIGEIVASTIPLTDAGLHLLDGTLISGSGSYSDFVDYIANLYEATKTYNSSAFTAVGTPTITDEGVASNFSGSNYINLPLIKPSNNFEFRVVFTTPNDVSPNMGIFRGQVNSSFRLALSSPSSQSTMAISVTDGTNSIDKNFTIQANTKYWVKFKVANGQYSYDYSTDGTNYTNVATGSTNLNINETFTVFTLGKNTSYYWQGSIDLEQFSISVGGTQVFNGSKANGFCLEDDWQTSVTNYGICGKFVYDSINNTVRLPKITGFIEGGTVSTLGDLTQAGLPNITGTWDGDELIHNGAAWANGAFYVKDSAYSEISTGTGGANKAIGFDASLSNSIYGNSNTVQPQSIKVLYYIVVATITKTDIQVDIDEIATDLNGKADVDLSNVPNAKGILSESYVNGYSWYRVYSDGWCEQGGKSSAGVQITFLKPFANAQYNVKITPDGGTNDQSATTCASYNITSTSFYLTTQNNTYDGYWQASGYIN